MRADLGFFDNTLLSFLEARTIPYIVVARLTKTIKHKAAELVQWTPIDDHYACARFTLQLHGWAKPREFFAIHERVRENKAAVGRRRSKWCKIWLRMARDKTRGWLAGGRMSERTSLRHQILNETIR